MVISSKITSKLSCHGHELFLHANEISLITVDCSLQEGGREGYKERQRPQLADKGARLPSSPVTCPLEHGTMQYSSSASQPVNQPGSQTGRIHPKGASRSSPLNLLHNRTALSQRLQTDPCLSNSTVTIKIWSEGASSPTLPLTQRANAPLKMHILPAHLVYLMHMHHTSGTKRNDIASDTEYSSSDIQFRLLQEEAAGFFFSPPLCYRANWTLGKCERDTGLVERHPSGCWLDSHLHTLNWLALHLPLNLKSVQTCFVGAKKTWRNTESSLCYQ